MPAVSLDVAGMEKRALLERASAAALAFGPEVIKAEASFSEEIREILLHAMLYVGLPAASDSWRQATAALEEIGAY